MGRCCGLTLDGVKAIHIKAHPNPLDLCPALRFSGLCRESADCLAPFWLVFALLVLRTLDNSQPPATPYRYRSGKANIVTELALLGPNSCLEAVGCSFLLPVAANCQHWPSPSPMHTSTSSLSAHEPHCPHLRQGTKNHIKLQSPRPKPLAAPQALPRTPVHYWTHVTW